jgi:hypothetical protein
MCSHQISFRKYEDAAQRCQHALDVWIHVTFPLFYRRVAPLYEASISGSTLIPTECWVCYIAPRAWHDSMAFSHHRLAFFTLVPHA